MAPTIEKQLHINAKIYIFFLFPRQRGISNTSGGIGKKDASENDSIASDISPLGFWARSSTQSYNFLIKPI